jgi:hypothetical protein
MAKYSKIVYYSTVEEKEVVANLTVEIFPEDGDDLQVVTDNARLLLQSEISALQLVVKEFN